MFNIKLVGGNMFKLLLGGVAGVAVGVAGVIGLSKLTRKPMRKFLYSEPVLSIREGGHVLWQAVKDRFLGHDEE
jgi:hypothetical protein